MCMSMRRFAAVTIYVWFWLKSSEVKEGLRRYSLHHKTTVGTSESHYSHLLRWTRGRNEWDGDRRWLQKKNITLNGTNMRNGRNRGLFMSKHLWSVWKTRACHIKLIRDLNHIEQIQTRTKSTSGNRHYGVSRFPFIHLSHTESTYKLNSTSVLASDCHPKRVRLIFIWRRSKCRNNSVI